MCPTDPARDPRDYFFSEVLHIPPGVRDPDHYTLLGLPYFVSDHDEIQRAAMERNHVLAACDADERPGYPEALAWIRRRVRSAQQTLLDPEKRNEYDARLIGRSSRTEPVQAKKEGEFKLPTGRMFAGRYRIMGEARWGGLGIVYEVLDGNLRRRMHLSALPPAKSADGQIYRRVEQAARAAATLDHPNILAINEVGLAQDVFYVTTRPPEGRGLFEWIEGTPRMRLDESVARDVTLEVARALDHAHRLGVTHGDLRPNRIYRDDEGRVQVVDFRVSRAAGGPEATDPRFRAPEGRDSIASDLFALGCVAFQMLTGLPPSEGAGLDHLEGSLPEEMSDDFRRLVLDLLEPDPEQRPESASKVVERLKPAEPPRRRRAVGAAAVVAVTVGLAAAIGLLTRPSTEKMGEAAEAAWVRIAEEDFEGAVAHLREARRQDPDNKLLISPMASALDGLAEQHLERDDPWKAQATFEEAQQLAKSPERRARIRYCQDLAVEKLRSIWIECPEVVQEVGVRVHVGEIPVAKVELDMREVAVEDGVATLDIEAQEEGSRTIRWRLVDVVQNRLEGEVKTIVDRTPPAIEIAKPADNTLLLTGEVRVEVRVQDANPPPNVLVRGKPVALQKGVARTLLRLPDGDHPITVEATDLAGLRQERVVRIVVDGSAPELELAEPRVVTRDGRLVVRGTARGRDVRLTVGGADCPVGPEGAFERALTLTESGSVAIEATGANGLRRKRSVEVIVDREAPVLSLRFDRRDPDGTLLYGLTEIVSGEVRIPILVEDASTLSYEPGEGRVEDGVWILDARQGRRTAGLVARDEAGNRSELSIALEGHRGVPQLEVKCAVPEITNADEAVLEITTNRDLTVQGKPAQPGKIRLPLEEGKVDVEVVASDRYGNTKIWSRRFSVDRTPPRLTLRGPSERGVGRQVIEIEANEPLSSVTCVGKTVQVDGTVARIEADLHPGRKKLHATGRDLAGNESKIQWPLVVQNRVLLLDGKSSIKLEIKEPLDRLTVECWVRGLAPTSKRTAVISNGGDQGFGLFWSSIDRSLPYASILVEEKGYVGISAKKGWRWDAWTHLALVYDGRRLRYFVNGSLQGSEAPSTKLARSPLPILIGAEPSVQGTPLHHFAGAIDEVRVSRVARYTRSFKPSRHFDPDGDTVALLHFDVVSDDGGTHPDATGEGRNGIPFGEPKLSAETR